MKLIYLLLLVLFIQSCFTQKKEGEIKKSNLSSLPLPDSLWQTHSFHHGWIQQSSDRIGLNDQLYYSFHISLPKGAKVEHTSGFFPDSIVSWSTHKTKTERQNRKPTAKDPCQSCSSNCCNGCCLNFNRKNINIDTIVFKCTNCNALDTTKLEYYHLEIKNIDAKNNIVPYKRGDFNKNINYPWEFKTIVTVDLNLKQEPVNDDNGNNDDKEPTRSTKIIVTSGGG